MAVKNDTKYQLSICLGLLQVVLVWSSICYLIWICLTPKDPVYTITSVHVSLSESRNSTFHITKVDQNASIILRLDVLNPNQGLAIYYDEIYLSLDFNNSVISNDSLHGFYQCYGENSTWNVPVKSGRMFWQQEAGRTTVDIKVSLRAAVRFKDKIFGTETKHYYIELEAYVPISLDGSKPGNINIKLKNSCKAKLTRKGS